MRPIRNFLDKQHGRFGKGGPLEKFYPLYEAVDTFLYTPGQVTRHPSHIRDGIDLKRYMVLVVVALIPCAVMALWNTGYQANTIIHNRRVAERLVEQGAIDQVVLTAAMQEAIGEPIEDVIVDTAVAVRVNQEIGSQSRQQEIDELAADGDRAGAESTVRQELNAQYRPEIGRRIDAALLAMDDPGEVPIETFAYTDGIFDWPDWQTRLMQGLGFNFDRDSLLQNLLYGALYFLPIYIVSVAVGGAWEVLFAIVRGHEVNEGLLVTSALFPLILPPTIPLWQVALGISFGVVIGKEIFGGTGRNFLNPALTGRAFLYFAYPAYLSGERIWSAPAVDGFSGATPLTMAATQPASAGLDSLSISWWQAFTGVMQGSMGETSVIACLLGAAILIALGIGSYKIMLGCVLGAVGMAAVFWGIALTGGGGEFLIYRFPPWWHLVTGGFAFGVVFMATDPVSASMTEIGKWWYGILIGVVTIIIRVINPAFPEGIMLAILLGNVFAPLIDYFVMQANIKRRLANAA